MTTANLSFGWLWMQIRQVLKAKGTGGVLARGSMHAFLLRGLGIGAAFGGQIFLARVLGTQEYGKYVYVLYWISLISLGSKLGFDVGAIRFLSAYRERGEWGMLRGFLKTGIRFVIGSSVVVSIAIALIVYALRNIALQTMYRPLLAGAALLPVLCLLQLGSAGHLGFKRVILGKSPEDLLRPLLVVGGISLLLFRGVSPDSVSALAANLAVTALLALGVWISFLRRLPSQARTASPQFQVGYWMRQSSALLLVYGFNMVLTQMDTLLVGMLCNTEQAGIYSVASRTSRLLLFGLISVNTIVAPVFSELNATNRMTELQRAASYAARGSFLFAGMGFVFLLLCGEFVLSLFGKEFNIAMVPLLLLSVGSLSNAWAGPINHFLTMTGRQGVAAKTLAISCVVNLVLDLLFIPRWGIVGAAAATCLVTIGWNIGLAVYVRETMRIKATAF